MNRRISLLLYTFLIFTLIFILQKPMFMGWYHDLYAGSSSADWWRVMWHGLPLDLSVAGYLSVVPALLLLVSVWVKSRWLTVAARIYFALAACLISLIFTVDLGLYEHWGFRLDSTPLFYFFSSPRDAFASMTAGMVVSAVLAFLLYAAAIYLLFRWVWGKEPDPPRRKWAAFAVLLVMTAALFIPIRGGFTVSTMNTGKVYFSNVTTLNHAALNPAFTLMESLGRETDLASQYRFMEPAEADRLFAGMIDPQVAGTQTPQTPDSLLFTSKRPDVILVVMESFSNYLMGELGGDGNVAVNLDSISREGILFTNFYANSFRTDRGLVSILSGYPGQPTMSVMKYPRKTQSLPSIAGSLVKNGYDARYYYGGDADFTNMRSYLVSSGYSKIVSDKDFPLSQRLSKWGAHDEVLFQRFVKDFSEEKPLKPRFRVIQTSSSHEPFEVPYKRIANERLNAFAYTDSCIGALMRQLRELPSWRNTVVIFVADHLGAYPEKRDNLTEARYRIPLVIAGGAVKRPMRVDTYASQQDLAATLLAQLGIGHSEFRFSKDIFNPQSPHFAFFSVPDAMGIADREGMVIFDNEGARTAASRGSGNTERLQNAKAYLQKLYDDLAAR